MNYNSKNGTAGEVLKEGRMVMEVTDEKRWVRVGDGQGKEYGWGL